MPTQSSILQSCIDRLSAHDLVARDELIEHSCERLQVLTRMLSRGDRVRRFADTDDILHGAILSLRTSLRKVRPNSVTAFLRLAAFHIRRELTRLAREYYGPTGWATRHVIGPDSESQLAMTNEFAANTDPSPSQVASNREGIERLYREIDALPDELRDTVDLLWLHGLKQRETAELLQVTRETVNRRWVRARLILLRKLTISEDARCSSLRPEWTDGDPTVADVR